MKQQKLPNATLVLVFGILSILGCCFYGSGIILGTAALVLAIKDSKLYAENPELYTGIQNVKTGKILSIIGIIISIIYILLIIWLLSIVGWESMGNEDLLQQRIQEFMGQ